MPHGAIVPEGEWAGQSAWYECRRRQYERGDFGHPKLEWRESGLVTVRGIDRTHDTSVTMNVQGSGLTDYST